MRLVQLQLRGGVHRVDAVLLVDRLAVQHLPFALVPGDEVVEAAGADHVAQHRAVDAFDHAALRDRHLGLRDGAVARDLDRRAAQEVQDAHALVPALLRDADEVAERPLEPGGHHHAFGVPDGGEALPVAGVAPHGPALHQLAHQELVGHRRSWVSPWNRGTLAADRVAAGNAGGRK
jgi:hypothetical protein